MRPDVEQRYVLPLIKPPTTPQLSQDKASIDESFEKSFALLEQLESETKALKEAEESRTSRLDAALSELETTISALKESDRKREDDARRNADELRMLRDLIPKALESEKSATEGRLKDLGTELKSLKTLIGSRMSSANSSNHRTTPSYSAGASTNTNAPAPASASAASTVQPEPSVATEAAPASSSPATTPAVTTPSSSAFPKFGSGKATIPAWQMAAAKRSQANGTSDKDTSTSGTVEEQSTST
jgi:peroxin-14